jgi:hypothetical protein
MLSQCTMVGGEGIGECSKLSKGMSQGFCTRASY